MRGSGKVLSASGCQPEAHCCPQLSLISVGMAMLRLVHSLHPPPPGLYQWPLFTEIRHYTTHCVTTSQPQWLRLQTIALRCIAPHAFLIAFDVPHWFSMCGCASAILSIHFHKIDKIILWSPPRMCTLWEEPILWQTSCTRCSLQCNTGPVDSILLMFLIISDLACVYEQPVIQLVSESGRVCSHVNVYV